MNVAINGFGRIGRQALRVIQQEHPDINVVLINDLVDVETLAYLFEFDSTYGHFDCGDSCSKDGMLATKKGPIRVTASKDPSTLPHKELKVDVVLECTGFFRKREDAAAHLKAGAKKVIISAPGKEMDGTFCMGVNHETYDPASMDIISNASCTTNCLSPMAKVLHDNFTIVHGFMTTVHSYTSTQALVDAPHKKDPRRGRAAAINMVPTSTGAAKAIGLVLPELDGKLDGMAIRVPTPTGSITDLTVQVQKETTVDDVNAAFKKAADGAMKGILGFEDRPLVQNDFVGDPRSSIIDGLSTNVHTEGGVTLVKTLSWYDNEWGYANRLVDLAALVGSKM